MHPTRVENYIGSCLGKYILLEESDGLAIVDAHALSRQNTYQKLKNAMEEGHIPSQPLLVPEAVTLTENEVETLLHHADRLQTYGILLERMTPTSIVVRECPIYLTGCNVSDLLKTLLSQLSSAAFLLTHIATHAADDSYTFSESELQSLLKSLASTNKTSDFYVKLTTQNLSDLFDS